MIVKKWYESKLVWLGVIITLQGFIPVAVEMVNKQSVTVADVFIAFSGLLAVVLRVWFTDAVIDGTPAADAKG
jgi:hypothetical protein